jgi:hypothetical protein
MRKLSLIIFFTLITVSLVWLKPSPHGKDFKISCEICHSPKGWEIDKSVYSFDHNATQLPLEGQHTGVNCKLCHPTLIFSEANTGCVDCHTDMHNQTVRPDCARCHTAKSWIVENIAEIHQRSRFPLIGPHLTADCTQCHKSESMLQFDPLGVGCIDCHQLDFMSTTQPNHVLGGFSINCTDCHLMNSISWTDADFVHTFFPLTGGHDNVNCRQCHTSGDYTNISNECVSCHQDDYNSTSNPNHISIDFPLICDDCHSTNPGWKPAQFRAHDSMFPIYSGKHKQEWDNCTDCHSNLGDYSSFSCTDCHAHNQQEMNNEHDGIGGYLFDSEFCYSCHPTGAGD